MTNSLRVLMMGTPDFAVPVLEALVEAGYQVVGVVTQPDRRVGRSKSLTAPPLKQAAERLGLAVLQPPRLRDQNVLDEVSALKPDLAVTAAYGQLLPQRFLDIPRYGCLNVHASLLPRWRGAAPIQRAMMAGDEKTGVTIMRTVLALDAGPMVGTAQVSVEPADNFGSLHDKLAQTGAKLLIDVLPGYIAGSLAPVPQAEAGVTYAERIVRQDEFIQLEADAKSVYNHARALAPSPGATVLYLEHPIKVWSDGLLDMTAEDHDDIGTVRTWTGGKVGVRCGQGWLSLVEVQASGKRRMRAIDWLNGQKGKTVIFQSVRETT